MYGNNVANYATPEYKYLIGELELSLHSHYRCNPSLRSHIAVGGPRRTEPGPNSSPTMPRSRPVQLAFQSHP